MPETFATEPFCAVFKKISGGQKDYRYEGVGVIKIFRRTFFFRLRVPKTIVGEDFCAAFEKALVAKISMDNKVGWGIKVFRRKFFVSLCRKLSQGSPSVLCFRKFPLAIKIEDKRGLSISSIDKIFVLQCRKVS